MSEMPLPDARDHLSEVAHQVAAGRVFYLTEGGRRLAAIVPSHTPTFTLFPEHTNASEIIRQALRAWLHVA